MPQLMLNDVTLNILGFSIILIAKRVVLSIDLGAVGGENSVVKLILYVTLR